jgi:hypothetical protein
MRRALIIVALCLPAAALGAGSAPEGRWTGSVAIPGRTLPLVVDLAPDPSGAWTGSFIMPGLGIKGAPLANVAVTADGVAFDTGGRLAIDAYGPASFRARVTPDGTMSGEMKQGGNTAPFVLTRTGVAQVERAVRSTPVGPGLAKEWKGDYELGGYPRHVTIAFADHPNAAATATFVIVGKQTNDLPVDLVTAEGDFVRIESQANQVAFEGRLSKDGGELRGVIELGPLEIPIVLRSAPGRTS